MITSKINFKNFRLKKKNVFIRKYLIKIIKNPNAVINSLKNDYKYSYKKSFLKRFKNYQNLRIIGMGGSVLGFKAIHGFLFEKIKKNIVYHDNLESFSKSNSNKNYLNLIISKSGNTIETIVNSNLLINKKNKNIFLTENKNNYLTQLAAKLKSDVIHHNNFIGGRYSVLSEVGMLPAELVGLRSENFKQFNNLIKNKKYINALINNVSAILHLVKKKNFNSVILNYDKNSEDLFFWYQQLVAESLGKKGKGILPIISTMPKDNHSLMQLYLDGFDKNFFTFFSFKEKNVNKINNSLILNEKNFLKNKSLQKVKLSQKKATEKVFKKKLLPFRSFEIEKRDEKTLGELFTFFILETILLGEFLDVNPYDQPSVELIKQETKKILI
jgi:glucose-6-phosphate isomerase